MTAPALPAALAAWSAELSALTDETALGLAPLVRGLASMVAGHAHRSAPHGEPDGIDGLTHRGSPHRIVTSEWLLADAAPLEFLRRAAEGELLHLAGAYRDSATPARLHVLADCGPGQLGAARVVQLAALIVLARRAAADRADLAVGLLGDPPGQWHEGGLDQLLRRWLKGRRAETPDPADVEAWTRTVTGGEIWLLTGPGGAPCTAAGATARPGVRTLVTREAGWDAAGARTVEVTVAGHTRRLTLPPEHVTIRALRGRGFRAADRLPVAPRLVAERDRALTVHHPVFPTAAPLLLGRGADPEVVVQVHLPDGTPRTHRFSGPVLTAWRIGQRLIALVRVGDLRLRVEVHGKKMPAYDNLIVMTDPADRIGDDAHQRALEPVVYNGELSFRWEERWWRVHPGTATVRALPPDANPLTGLDRLAHANGRPGNYLPNAHTYAGRRMVFGTPDTFAIADPDELSWQLYRALAPAGRATATDRVISLVMTHQRPALLQLSPGGQILRLSAASGQRALTRWSGGVGVPAAHPTLPWVAVTRPDGTIEVGDIDNDRRIAVIGEP